MLLTREAEKNVKLRRLLEARGIETYELPLVEHARVEAGTKELIELLRRQEIGEKKTKKGRREREREDDGNGDASRLLWFVTTSPESAAVFKECWKEAGKPTRLRIASIGMGTTRVLEEEEEGGEGEGSLSRLIAFTPSKATGKTLANELPRDAESETDGVGVGGGRGGRGGGGDVEVVYPASTLASDDVESNLRRRGFRVKRINTYSTSPVEFLTEQQVEAASGAPVVTFGSPSAIKAWKRLVKRTDVYCCCIGGTSHSACIKHGFPENQIFSPDKPGLEGWARVVGEALEQV